MEIRILNAIEWQNNEIELLYVDDQANMNRKNGKTY